MKSVGHAGRRAAQVGAVVLALALQACATGGSSDSPRAVNASHEGDVSSSAGRIDQFGKERFPAQYAGVERNADRVVVYRKPSAEFDHAVRDLHLPVEVVVRDAPYSAAELQTLAERVQSDIAYWQGLGIPINTVGARHDGTAVEVGTDRPEQASQQFSQRYGAAPPVVAVAIGPVVPVPAR